LVNLIKNWKHIFYYSVGNHWPVVLRNGYGVWSVAGYPRERQLLSNVVSGRLNVGTDVLEKTTTNVRSKNKWSRDETT